MKEKAVVSKGPRKRNLRGKRRRRGGEGEEEGGTRGKEREREIRVSRSVRKKSGHTEWI